MRKPEHIYGNILCFLCMIFKCFGNFVFHLSDYLKCPIVGFCQSHKMLHKFAKVTTIEGGVDYKNVKDTLTSLVLLLCSEYTQLEYCMPLFTKAVSMPATRVPKGGFISTVSKSTHTQQSHHTFGSSIYVL